MAVKKKRSPPKKGETKKKSSKRATKKKARFRTGGGGGDVYDRLRARDEERRRSSGRSYWRPAIGSSTIRVVPFEHEGEEEVFVEQHSHFMEKKAAPILCIGSDCPICKQLKTSDSDGKDRRRRSRQFLFNAVVREHPEHDDQDTLCVCQVSPTVYSRTKNSDRAGLFDYLAGDQAIPSALDLKKGRDFKIVGTKGQFTKYKVVPLNRPSAVGMEVNPVDLLERHETALDTAREKLPEIKKLAAAM